MQQQKILEGLLRKGVIPMCGTGSTFCFALYSAKLLHAADLWETSIVPILTDDSDSDSDIHNFQRQETTDPLLYHRESVKDHAQQLRQHSGTCLCLSLISGAIAREGYLDWLHYSGATSTSSTSSLDELALQLWKRQRPVPFFLRPTVLVVACLSLAMSRQLHGGWKLWQPEQPMYYHTQT